MNTTEKAAQPDTVQKDSMPADKPLTYAEWNAEGVRRFGTDRLNWKFKCPACGHVQAVVDFRPYKAQGATPESARFSCIGRYSGAVRKAFGGDGPGPCDFTGGGLIDLRPLQVIDADGEIIRCFEFADPKPI